MTRLFKAFVLLALVSSCAKLPVGQDAGGVLDEFVSITLNISDSPDGTKANPGWGEPRIRDLYILEFDSKGYNVYCGHCRYDGNPTIPALKNQKVKIYVVANSTNDLSEISTESEYLNTKMSYTELNAAYPEMTGSIEGIFSSSANANVELQRMCSRIQVDTISFRINDSRYDFNQLFFDGAYIERMPSECSYGLVPSGISVDASDGLFPAGCYMSQNTPDAYYMDGDWKVWEYDHPWSVYALPNDASGIDQRSELALEYEAHYRVGQYSNGEYEIVTKILHNALHFILPPLSPNSIYELEKIVVNQPKTTTVDLSPIAEQSCMFIVRDVASGKVLGHEKGILRYEISDT